MRTFADQRAVRRCRLERVPSLGQGVFPVSVACGKDAGQWVAGQVVPLFVENPEPAMLYGRQAAAQ